MVYVGIDVGSRFLKAVSIGNRGEIRESIISPIISEQLRVENILGKLLGENEKKDVKMVVTGAGCSVLLEEKEKLKEGGISLSDIPDVIASFVGAYSLNPKTRVVIDSGAERTRVISGTEDGCVKDFVLNEKCAAGSGTFIETITRLLGYDVEEIDKVVASTPAEPVPMSSQCTVFAESETITLLNQKMPREKIAHAIFDGMAERIASLARRIALQKDVVMVGGVGRMIGVRNYLTKKLNMEIKVVTNFDPMLIPAYGAAYIALYGYRGSTAISASVVSTRIE